MKRDNLTLIDDYLRLLAHYECPQNKWELSKMLAIIDGKHSLLEIGSSFGGTLKRMAEVLAPKSTIVSVDYPSDETPDILDPLASLRHRCQMLVAEGHRVELILADSHAAQTIANVRRMAPFEFGFIDGDHSYEGVKADWENYGPMCEIVGFHDIAGPVDGCRRFWNELKDSRRYRTEEFIRPGTSRFGPPSENMGIGIVYRT